MGWIKRSYKRDWLQRAPSLNTVAYKHEMSNVTAWDLKPEAMDKPDNKRKWPDDYFPHEVLQVRFETIFSIGSNIIKLHANDFIDPMEALKDYHRKIELIREVIQRFVRDYKSFYDRDSPFIIKEFLNGSEGPSAIYTSTIAISCSTTHDFFFEIASCDDKARMYMDKEKDFLEMLHKLQRFVLTAGTDAKSALDTYKGKF